jgi:hypothetical protein
MHASRSRCLRASKRLSTSRKADEQTRMVEMGSMRRDFQMVISLLFSTKCLSPTRAWHVTVRGSSFQSLQACLVKAQTG